MSLGSVAPGCVKISLSKYSSLGEENNLFFAKGHQLSKAEVVDT